jgi:hypothetical protein
VDIHFERFKDWLIDRKMLSQDHVQELKTVRAYIKHAWKETRAQHKQNTLNQTGNEAEKLVEQLLNEVQERAMAMQEEEDAIIDYEMAKRVTQTLEQVDGSNSGYLFGLVGGSKRLKLWRHVIQSYENKLLYMAEVATKMISNVKYEIPALRKNIVKLQKQLDDLNKKEQDWKRSVDVFQKKFKEQCNELCISGENVDAEIPQLVNELPSYYAKIREASCSEQFEQAFKFYVSFASFMSGKDLLREAYFMPVLKFLLENKENNDLSLYEYKKYRKEIIMDIDPAELEEYREKKEEEAKQKELLQKSKASDVNIEIDWSALDIDHINNQNSAEIVWNESEIDTDISKTIEIEFGDSLQEVNIEITQNMVDNSNSTPLIESSSGNNMTNNKENEETKEQKMDKILFMMNESIFSDDEARNAFINDILELEAFFDSRIREKIEAANTANNIDGEIFKNAPTFLQNQSVDQLKRYRKSVEDVVKLVNDERFRQLILIKTSTKYVERITKALKQRLEIIEKLQNNIAGVESRRSKFTEKIENMKPQIDKLINEATKAQQFLESNLTAVLKKPVHIFGEINALK